MYQRKFVCSSCRKSKIKCDGDFPCGRCVIKGTYCMYIPLLKPGDIDLSNLAIRRKYIESYMQGINPATLILNRVIDKAKFDFPCNKSTLLQMNSILASSTRAFGAPPRIYKQLEARADSLALELSSDSSFDTALGLNFYSYYLWGEDEFLSKRYRDIAAACCVQAAKLPQNHLDQADLNQLQLLTHGIGDNFIDDEDVKILLLQQSNPADRSLLTYWSSSHIAICHLLIREGESGERLFNHLSDGEFREYAKLFGMYTSELIVSKPYTPSQLIFYAGRAMIMGCLCHAAGRGPESLKFIREGIGICQKYNYILGMAGVRTRLMLHSSFIISMYHNDLSLCEIINEIQYQLAKLLPTCARCAQNDEIALQKAINSRQQGTFPAIGSTSQVHVQVSTTPSPFGKTEIALPVTPADQNKQNH